MPAEFRRDRLPIAPDVVRRHRPSFHIPPVRHGCSCPTTRSKPLTPARGGRPGRRRYLQRQPLPIDRRIRVSESGPLHCPHGLDPRSGRPPASRCRSPHALPACFQQVPEVGEAIRPGKPAGHADDRDRWAEWGTFRRGYAVLRHDRKTGRNSPSPCSLDESRHPV